jgi:beta-glucanase (GH16 family)
MLPETPAFVGPVRCALVSAGVFCGIFSSALVACSADGTAAREEGAAPPPPAPSSAPTDPDTEIPAGAVTSPGEPLPSSPEAPVPGTDTSLGPASPPGSAAPLPGASEFELAWQDDFDTFDATRWQLMTHSWDTNLAQFSTQNVRVENGIAALDSSAEPADALKPFRGVEMRSLEALTYGKVEARARLAKGSGVVSSLVLIYTPWPADDWNELDIEYLGRYPDRVQFNSMVYLGPPTQPPVAQSVMPTQFPQLAPLAFDASADFHVYAMEWTPSAARFSVDGQLAHTWNLEIARLKRPMNILLTIWVSSAADWAGPIDASSAPTAAEYDWLKVYRYIGARP